VIKLRHQQPSLWHKGLAKDIEDLWEPWMREVDQLLEDAALVEEVYQAQGKRHPKSQTRGRTQTPAEVVLRLLILKHAERPEDSRLLIPAVEQHQRQFGRPPRMVAADTGFYSLKNERTIQAMGVRRVAVPSRSTKSSERRKLQRTRWFRAGQRWRTGCEGRISVLKRRHGLSRCRYRGFEGMQRWVGLGVIADNIIQIGRCLAMQRA